MTMQKRVVAVIGSAFLMAAGARNLNDPEFKKGQTGDGDRGLRALTREVSSAATQTGARGKRAPVSRYFMSA